MPNVLRFNDQIIWRSDWDASDGINVVQTRWVTPRDIVIDRIGSYDGQGVYRSSAPIEAVFQMDVWVGYNSFNDSGDIYRTWKTWHSPSIGRALLKFSRDDGVQMQCYMIARAPKEASRTGYRRMITQEYEAETPWFTATSVSTASDSFNGTSPVNLSVPVAGDLATRPVYTITGPVENGKITMGGETLVELTMNVLSGQTLVIDCTRLITMTWSGTGVTDSNALGYFDSSSLFSPLPVGDNTLVLTAAAGSTGSLSVQTTALYEEIGA